jgi:hypothetical protein
MTELEQALVDLGRRVDFPPTPDLTATLRTRLATGPTRARWTLRRGLVLAFALLAVAVGAAFAVPPARTAILEWLGLQGATVERVVTLPEVEGVGKPFLGERVSLQQARERVAFPVLVPEALGPPDEVYVEDRLPVDRVSLVYGPEGQLAPTPESGVGLLLIEFRGDLEPELIGKLAAEGTIVEEVTVNGSPGVWLEGAPHAFFYRDDRGEIREETLRLAANTLLLERGSLLVRIESELTKAETLRVAESLR